MRTGSRVTTALLVLSGTLLGGCGDGPAPAEADRLRLGWQVPWATQGQLVQILKHTDLASRNGLDVTFSGFSYGAPLNEAALAGEVDVLLTADQPAATLIARDTSWAIIGRLMYNRVAIYVPPRSRVHRVSDLRGLRIGIPFGAAAHRFALEVLAEAGVNPDSGVQALNLDIYEHGPIVASGSDADWGDIDALVGFDPTPALFEVRGQARILAHGNVVSLVLANRRFLAEHPEAAARFLKALHEAYWYYSQNPEHANAWFAEGARLTLDHEVLRIAASVEPNVAARSPEEITLDLTPEDFRVLEEAAAFIHARGMVPSRVDMRGAFEPGPLRRARSLLQRDGFASAPAS